MYINCWTLQIHLHVPLFLYNIFCISPAKSFDYLSQISSYTNWYFTWSHVTINNSQRFILLLVYCPNNNLCALVVKLKGLTSMVIQGENIFFEFNIKNYVFKTNKTKDLFRYIFFKNWCISKVIATSLLICCRLLIFQSN